MDLKKPISFEAQIEKLKGKNIIIEDCTESIEFLRCVNYYRFSAYFLPFRGPDGKCFDRITFHKIRMIYEFDQRLRSIVADLKFCPRVAQDICQNLLTASAV